MTDREGRPVLAPDLAGAIHRPLVLSERFLADARRRQILQAPGGTSMRELVKMTSRIEGIPLDVLFALDALTLLAEQGNEIAKTIVFRERRRLGIDLPKRA
jgi:hypothetical protein